MEKTIAGLAEAMDHAVSAEEIAGGGGLLQSLDPRVKIVGVFLLVLAAVSARRLPVILGVFAVALTLAALSRIPWRVLARRAWVGVLAFTGVVALPAVFLTPGPRLGELPILHWPITGPGVLAASRLVARAETAATLVLILILSTPWAHVLKALRILRVPAALVLIFGMTHRYIFLLLTLTRDSLQARRGRLVGPLDGTRRRQLAAGTAGVLLGKSLQLSNEVFLAMQSRGFRGEFHLLDDFRLRPRDWVALPAFLALAALAFWLGAS